MSSNTEIKIVPPETVGFSSKRLERVNELVSGLIDDGDLPGAVTLVLRLCNFQKVTIWLSI